MSLPRCTPHTAAIARDGESFVLRCACGLWLCSDWVEVVGELSAHMGASLPGYDLPRGGIA